LAGDPYLTIRDYTRKYLAYFGVATYSYKNLYTVNGNIRFDGSNLFGSNPKFRWKPTWSVAARWNIMNQAFMKNVGFMNELALRGSYGVQGSTNEQNSPQLIAKFLSPGYYSNLNLLGIEQPANPNLRWEKTYNANIGLDFKLFNYRVNGSLNFYKKRTVDLITLTRISQVNGFTLLPINFGDVENKGIELGITTQNIRNKVFSWSTTINLSYNRNQVTKVNRTPQVSSMLSSRPFKPAGAIVVYSLNSLWSVKFADVDPSNGIARFYYANGDTTKATTGLDFGVNDLVYNGPIKTPYTGGFQNTFDYKNLELSFFFTFGAGNKIRMNPIMQSWMYSPDQNLSKTLLKAWGVNGNVHTNIPNILTQTGTHTYKERWNQSNIRVTNGSYLRLKNVSFKYNLPHSLLDKLGISKAYFKLEGNNLLLFDDDKLYGLDPETLSFNGLPNLRTYAIDIHISF
jgi:hypothetical protein